MHKFVVLLDGKILTFNKYDDIPKKIDNIIEFCPSLPKPPHTPDQHIEIDEWNKKLKELLRRETNASSN